MLQSPTTSTFQEPNVSQEVEDLIERDPRVREKPGPFEFWYRWTAPAPQPLTASFELREKARQGRLTSTVLAMIAGALTILAIPTSFATNNPILLVVLCFLLTVTGISLFLNKIGHGFSGRWLSVIAVNFSLYLSILTFALKPGGLTTNILPILDILVVEPILMALVLLPPASSFLLGVCNAAFIAILFATVQKSPDLLHFMSSDAYEIITRPLYLMLFVIAVVYPVMRSALRAIALGDRAKEIAKVQRDLANREAAAAGEKKQLEEGVNQLSNILREINNGNALAHVPFPTVENLWPIASGLNTLQMRIRNAHQKELEYQHTQQAAAWLIQELRSRKRNQRALPLGQTGNPIIDAIIQEL